MSGGLADAADGFIKKIHSVLTFELHPRARDQSVRACCDVETDFSCFP